MVSIIEKYPEVAKQWHPTKNGDLKPENFTYGSKQKIWWLCEKTCSEGCLHEWETNIKNRCGKDKTGCIFCKNKKICKHQSILYRKPEIAKQWHPTKNGDLTPEMVSLFSNKKVWWLCEKKCSEGCLHEWEAIINNRCKEKSSGCPFCQDFTESICKHQSILYTNPEVAKQWHPTKNGELKPEMCSPGSTQKVWWLCEKKCSEGCLHEWESVIGDRCKKEKPYGCSFCSNKSVCIHQSIIYTHPEIVKQWHPTKNGELKPEMFSFGSGQKIWWKIENFCKYNCVFEYEISINLKCRTNLINKNKVLCKHQSILYTNPEIAKEWHPTKNGELNPEMVSPSSAERIYWICPKNHIYDSIIVNRCICNSSCPYCFKKSESKLYDILSKKYKTVNPQFIIEGCQHKKNTNCMYKYDFFIPELNLIIEMDGMQHFKQVSNWDCPLKTQERDVFKMKKALEKGISIIRILQEDIWKYDENFILSILDKYLIRYPKPKVIYFDRNNLYNNHILLMEELDIEIPE
jgi:very-short-patch-repair endonuclease